MSGGFNNPLVGGGGGLVYPSIHSPGFVSGSTGWSINKNGTAEFNSLTVRNGTIISGLFLLYNNAVPVIGGLVMAFAPLAGGTDSVGNVYPVGFNWGTWDSSGVLRQHFGIDLSGNLYVADTAGTTRIFTTPFQNLPVVLSTALSGVFTSAMQFSSSDANEVVQGELAAVQLGTGTAAKMCTILMSPFGTTTGTALLLQAENDGSTDSACVTICTVTSNGSTLTLQPTAAFIPNGFIIYSGGGSAFIITKTVAGSGNIPIPVGITTVLAECWGGGGGGAFGTVGNLRAGSGGGGGEYAAEPALAVTHAAGVNYVVGAAGAGGFHPSTGATNGTASTLTGTSVTVTANPGIGAGTTGGAGGSGSTNTTHNSGGAGFTDPSQSGAQFGGGGGGSGGTGAAGNGGAGNFGATAVIGGGPGGNGFGGGAGGHSGVPPVSGPGGGGGGGSNIPASSDNGGNGFAGQVRVTYSTGAPALLFSTAAASGTDQFGTAYPSGTKLWSNLPTELAGPLLLDNISAPAASSSGPKAFGIGGNLRFVSGLAGDGNSYATGRLTLFASGQTVSSLGYVAVTGIGAVALGIGTYHLKGMLIGLAVASGVAGFISTEFIAGGGLVAGSFGMYQEEISGGAPYVVRNAGYVTALGASSQFNGATFSSTTIQRRVMFDGVIVVTTAGTLTYEVACGTSAADTWNVQAGTYLEVTPI